MKKINLIIVAVIIMLVYTSCKENTFMLMLWNPGDSQAHLQIKDDGGNTIYDDIIDPQMSAVADLPYKELSFSVGDNDYKYDFRNEKYDEYLDNVIMNISEDFYIPPIRLNSLYGAGERTDEDLNELYEDIENKVDDIESYSSFKPLVFGATENFNFYPNIPDTIDLLQDFYILIPVPKDTVNAGSEVTFDYIINRLSEKFD
ncbi:MAG: hypothetical protein Kow0068_02130 [Marinilabiliales bacterium]